MLIGPPGSTNADSPVGWLFDLIFKVPVKTIFQSCWDGATTSWVLPVLSGVNVPCSRTQHGLTRVGLEPPTSGSGVGGINQTAQCFFPYFFQASYIFLYFKQISYFHISLTNLAINPKKSCFHRIYSINPSASGGAQTQTQMLPLLYFHTLNSLSPGGLEMFFSVCILKQ